MKSKFIVLNKGYIILISILIICLLVLSYNVLKVISKKESAISNNKETLQTDKMQKIEKENKNINIKQATEKFEKKINSDVVEVKEYAFMPQYIKNFLVIGELQIPSIQLDTYILGENSDKALNVSVTKLTGPSINEKGNFCITGHNYLKDNMFGRLKKVNIGDQIVLIDTFGKSKEYKVYDKYEVAPEDTSILKQDTNGKSEVTLITCTTGALKRIVVKATEI